MSELIESLTAEGLFIYQIFYDETTRAAVDPGFIPLDNSANTRPDWYEFWVILDFLRRTELRENAWYGFLSPRFFSKVGMPSGVVHSLLRAHADHDVLLLPYAWNITCYGVNQFEMGERSHAGLMAVSKPIFDALGYDINKIISHMGNSNYSNYVVGKRSYWRSWQRAAEALFAAAEGTELGDMTTFYKHRQQHAPMKAFIQERISSVILFYEPLRIFAPDISETAPFVGDLLRRNEEVRRGLRNLDLLKRRAIALKDGRLIEDFLRRRAMLRRSWAT